MSREQVRAYRLEHQHLLRRAPRRSVENVVGAMGGAQAQVLSAAGLSVRARVDAIEPADLDSALWERRSLVRAWCMRRTLHVVPAREVAVFARGTAGRAEKEVRWMLNAGVPEPVLEDAIAATLNALDEPLTRTELADRVARATRVSVVWDRGGGWGRRARIPCVKVGPIVCPAYYLLHLAGARGVICSGPIRDGGPTFVRADAWVRSYRDVAAGRAEDALLDHYLSAHGPATVSDFVAWTGVLASDAKEIWARAEDRLASVEVEGDAAWILRADLPSLERSVLAGSNVRLLPHFDSFLLGHDDRTHLVDAAQHPHVYRNQGWVSPVVLVNGQVRGVWSQTRRGRTLDVTIRPFRNAPQGLRRSLRDEAEDLGRFQGCRETHLAVGGAI